MKRFICAVLAVLLALQPLTASAIDLDQAFSGLLGPGSAATASAPGRFSSASRTGATLGGFEVRVPRASVPTLLNATPPRIKAGCNGISAHFGGFSFISGTDFTKLMEQIASGAAMGFVASLVMKSLCPMCEAVVQELKSAAQAAARLAKDSCALGEQFARAYFGGTDDTGGGQATCEKVAAEAGSSSDTLSASQELCVSLRQASTTLNEWAGPDKDKVAAENGFGNITWQRLRALSGGSDSGEEFERDLMLINLMGAQMAVKEGEDIRCDTPGGGTKVIGTDEAPESDYCAPMTDWKTLAGLFMCGMPENLSTATTSERVKKYCSALLAGSLTGGGTGVELWNCSDAKNCPYLEAGPASEVIKGEGLMIRTNRLLTEAAKRVREASPSAFQDQTGREILALVDAVPYPLYQAINAAAVYPAAGIDIVDSMSILVGEQFAYAFLNDILRQGGRGSSGMRISEKQAEAITQFMAALRSQAEANRTTLAGEFAIQQGLTEQIRIINNTIQRSVMNDEMLSSGQAAQAINRALAPTGASD